VHNQEFLSCPYQIRAGWSNQGGTDRWGMWCVWRRGEVHAEFWWGIIRIGGASQIQLVKILLYLQGVA